MSKVLKNKLIITLVTVAVVGGILTKTLPMFHNACTIIKQSQASNIKEKDTKGITVNSKNIQKKDVDKDLNSLSSERNAIDNSQNSNTNKQETSNSKLEKTNKNKSAKKNVTNNSRLKDAKSNVNTENQSSTNATLKENVPMICYDRTTSIYANDNITLLRIEYYINNKLTYYSVIEQFDAGTKSYIEKIYQCNRETNIDPLIRTDVYVNNNLIKSY